MNWEGKLKVEKMAAMQVPKYFTKATSMDKEYWSAPDLMKSTDLLSVKGKRIAMVVHEPVANWYYLGEYGDNGKLFIYDSSFKKLKAFMFNWILSGAIVPNGKAAIGGDAGGTELNQPAPYNIMIGCDAKIYVVSNLDVIKTIKVNDGVRKMLVLGEGSWVITGEGYGHVSVINTQTLTVVSKARTDRHIQDITELNHHSGGAA